MDGRLGEDLHMHSVWSRDSDASIDDLVRDIVEIQKGDILLREVSKTEHNTLAGTVEFHDKLKIACEEARVQAPQIIPGVEVSLWHGEGDTLESYHILAYFPIPPGGNFETHVHSLERGAFGKMLADINDIKRARMKRFIEKWLSNRFLDGVQEQEVEDLIWLIDQEVGNLAPMGHEGPAYMRSDVFDMLEQLYTPGSSIQQIRNALSKGHPDRGLVRVPYADVGQHYPLREGLCVIKGLPQQSVTCFAHPWEYTQKLGEEGVQQLILDHHRAGLLDGVQTQGHYVAGVQDKNIDDPHVNIKCYKPLEDQSWESFASQYNMVAVSGSDAHGTQKEGVHIRALKYHPRKFEKNTTPQTPLTQGELVVAQ